MIPIDILQQTEQRYAVRSPERVQTEYKLRTGSKLLVDDPARVDARIRRLRNGGFNHYLAELATPPSAGSTVRESPASDAEFSETRATHVPDISLRSEFVPVTNLLFAPDIHSAPGENILIDIDPRERII